MSVKLTLQSEKYAPTGSMAADGYQKLLGAPGIDRLQTVIRETVQNTNDAAIEGRVPRYLVRLRFLTGDQARFLEHVVFRETPPPGSPSKGLREFLVAKERRVLEICDFNTSGLGGPTRADGVPPEGEPTDFIDFVRNIGSPRDTHHGGGTYGYGKASLYLSGRPASVIIDSRAVYKGEPVRRVIASHLGGTFDIKNGANAGRYTGRHWWGTEDGDGAVEPLTGDDASLVAGMLGMPEREESDTGTSIMILGPEFEEDDDRVTIGRIQEAILWHFWPKMMNGANGRPAMEFSVELNGEVKPLPDPAHFPPFNIFLDCLRAIDSGEEKVSKIRCRRPAKELGRMMIKKDRKLAREWLVPDPEEKSIIPETSRHVALMRPARLVVTYFQGALLPEDDIEWAGVFICDEEDDVERAFAAAEPPAHDSWDPHFLPKGRQKTFVNVALREIRTRMQEVTSVRKELPPGGSPVTAAADLLGRFLSTGDRVGKKGNKPHSPGKKKSVRTTGPEFVRLEERVGVNTAVFRVVVDAPVGSRIAVTATPLIVLEGGSAEDTTAPNGEKPAFTGWEEIDGVVVSKERMIMVDHQFPRKLHACVSIPDYVAVSLRVSAEEQKI